MESPNDKHASEPTRQTGRRQWFQVGLRSCLALMLLVAIVFGLYARYVRPYQIQLEARTTIQRLGGNVVLRPAGYKWFRDLAGPDVIQDVISVDVGHCKVDAAAFSQLLNLRRVEIMVVSGPVLTQGRVMQLSKLRRLETLVLDSAPITAETVAELSRWLPNTTILRSHRYTIEALSGTGKVVFYHDSLVDAAISSEYQEPRYLWSIKGNHPISDVKAIARMTTLEELELPLSNINDRSLQLLTPLQRLTVLNLGATRVTDEGLAHLREFPKLKKIYLYGTSITDAGLANLSEVGSLETIYLEDTGVTDAGLANLRAALPNATISPVLRFSVSAVADNQPGIQKPIGAIHEPGLKGK